MGQDFDPEDLASKILDAADGEFSSAGEGGSSATLVDSGSCSPLAVSSASDSQWQWDPVRKSKYFLAGRKRVYEAEKGARADTDWQWDPHIQQQCRWSQGVYMGAVGTAV